MQYRKPRKAKRDTKHLDHAIKVAQALDMRRRGHSYDEIAKELKIYDKSLARRMVLTAIANIPREASYEVLELEIARLDRMLAGLSAGAESGDLESVDRALKIQVRRAALMGLDCPKKTEVTGANGGPIEMVTAADRIRSRLGRLANSGGEGSGNPEPGANT